MIFLQNIQVTIGRTLYRKHRPFEIGNWYVNMQKNRGEELRKTSFGWPGNESSGWAKNRAVINRPKSLHLILRHKKIHSDLSYTLKAWLIIFIKF